MFSLRPTSTHDDAQWLIDLRDPTPDRAAAAFEAIFHALGHPLWHFAARYVSPSQADDVLQDIFLTLWQRRATLAIQSTLTAYLFGAVRRRALELRRRDHTASRLQPNVEHDAESWMARPAPAPDAEASLAEVEASLDAVLTTLPDRTREILTLRWRHGMTYEQIAEVLDMSPAAAKMQASRMGKIIRPLLERFRG